MILIFFFVIMIIYELGSSQLWLSDRNQALV